MWVGENLKVSNSSLPKHSHWFRVFITCGRKLSKPKYTPKLLIGLGFLSHAGEAKQPLLIGLGFYHMWDLFKVDKF
jgi:hypothetical protein